MLNIFLRIKDILYPMCSEGDILCQWTNGRWFFPTQLSSILAPLNMTSLPGFIAVSTVLGGASLYGLYKNYYMDKKQPSIKQLVSGFSEQMASLAGFAVVDGLRPIMNATPYYLSRYSFRLAIDSSAAPKEESLRDFSISRLKDINIGVMVGLFANFLKPLLPYKGILPSTALSTVANVFAGMLYRGQGAFFTNKTDKILTESFNKEKMVKDALNSTMLFFAINSSLKILNDYVIQNNDPLKTNYPAYLLSGMAGELVLHCGKTLVNQYYANVDVPAPHAVKMKRA